MNSLEKNNGFRSVPNRLNYMSLKTIYDLGRNTNDNHYEGFDQHLSLDKQNDILKVIKPLYKFLLSGKARFYPIFIEFALFDPTNVDGNKFYSILTSPYDELFSSYLTEMKNNVYYKGNSRGPLIPNEGLYNFTYYRLFKDTNRYFKIHTTDDLSIKFGCFTIKSEKEDTGDKIETYVNSFLEKTLHRFQNNNKMKSSKSSKHIKKLNRAMLIPLFRPAAPIDPNIEEHQEIFRGGGLFIYGATEDDFNEDLFTLEIRAFLMKSILEASHNEIEIEKLKSLQADLELHLYHHFGSNLRSLPDLFSLKNFGSDNLTDFQKGIISTIQSYLKGHIDNTRSVLSSYQQYLDSDGILPKFSVASLKDVFDILKQEIEEQEIVWAISPNNITLQTEALRGNEIVTLTPKIFRNFIEQFIQNATKAYDELELKDEERKIEIRIIRKGDSVGFNFFNQGTEIDPFVIKRAGIKPIKSVNSSGLGYYFLNFSLKLCGAQKCSEGRFFGVKNNISPKGVLLSFSFKIL